MNYQRIDAQKLFPSVKQRLFSVYGLFGYEELSLPLFEQYEKYLQYKAVSDETLLKIIDRTGNILVLRPDATFHVLKTIGSMNFSENRYCYMTNVFRFKENNYEKNDIMQAGVELFNAPSAHADAEIIAVAIESLKALGIDDIHFDLGHSKFVHQFLKEIGITKESDIIYYHSLIENKNLVALSDLLYKEKITSEHIDLLCNIAMLFGQYQTVLDKAGALCINKKMERFLEEIRSIYRALDAYGLCRYVHLDLGFSNPMNYYSGMIFKGYVIGHGEAVISGGRYDNLAQQFAGKHFACGLGQNIDVTMDILLNHPTAPAQKTCFIGGEDYRTAVQLAAKLRSSGQKCVLYFDENHAPCTLGGHDIQINIGKEHSVITGPKGTKTVPTLQVFSEAEDLLC